MVNENRQVPADAITFTAGVVDAPAKNGKQTGQPTHLISRGEPAPVSPVIGREDTNRHPGVGQAPKVLLARQAGGDRPAPSRNHSRHLDNVLRGPVMRTGVAALTFLGGGAVSDGDASSAVSLQNQSPCYGLPFLNAPSHPSPELVEQAEACYQLVHGEDDRQIVVVYAGPSTPRQRSTLEEGIAYFLDTKGLLKLDIQVVPASGQETEAIQQAGPATCDTPAKAIPAYAVSQQISPKDIVVLDLPGLAKKCGGVAYPGMRIAEVFTGVHQGTPGDPNYIIEALNAHEILHNLGLWHRGKFTVSSQKPLSFEEFVNQATYQVYGNGDGGAYNNSVMGMGLPPDPTYNISFNTIEQAELGESAVLTGRAKPEATRLGDKWLSISPKEAVGGKFAFVPLDNPIMKFGHDTLGNINKVPDLFDTLMFVPVIFGTKISVEIYVFSTHSRNMAVIGNPFPVTNDLTTIVYKNQAIQYKSDPHTGSLDIRTVSSNGLGAFFRPNPTRTHYQSPTRKNFSANIGSRSASY